MVVTPAEMLVHIEHWSLSVMDMESIAHAGFQCHAIQKKIKIEIKTIRPIIKVQNLGIERR